MVVGNGMIARRFETYQVNDDFVIFASGVSNSKSIDDKAYQREKKLLQATVKENPAKTLIYFSTCSIYDPEEQASKYVLHKKDLEAFIQKNCKQFYIFRVSNLVGNSGNPNTVLNFFIQHIRNKINFHLWTNATRNLIDIDDMYRIADHILQNRFNPNTIINIANPTMYRVKEIISAIESWWKVKANYIAIEKGNPFTIDISVIAPVINSLSIRFDKDYLINLLRKYYSEI
jgi:nucleoside-diphosphate-sugar epimerase